MLTIILLTFKEIVRRRILLVTVILAAVFLALYGAAVHYGYQEMSRGAGPLKALIAPQFLALGLYFGSFIISFLAVMAAVGTISSEIENGIMHAIVPGPVRRSTIILGKFCGYSLMLTVFAALFYIAVLLIVHYNTGLDIPVKAAAAGLFCLQPLILLAVAMLGSTFLSTLANGIAAFMLYSVGVVGGMLEQIGYLAGSNMMVNIGIASSLLMPADAVYRKIVYSLLSVPGASLSMTMLGPFGSGAEPSVWMLAYAACYILGFLLLALRIFSKKDI
ncbi:ABC transporter permease [Pelotomaculum terephthalicicum JT]|uniref:ABC transporter permease n=1 Tax=Pelotomaculum TaxID=191373 RepID=UPI0009CA27B2|nr:MULTISPECIES: ABC transporter permease subunit [Pelotomaculum]MCG9966690.1 ABC transporter permease [Pelotomaculum terephthalicicum JT]OPX91451.1 MAG: ABC-2 family transporter protein [Pelotomaculum sp. PtaB.Bin117]OPY62989.1 MAG: ABC-2 family transporter protein [Pelotomaculum sp. PtaU1.Bin065]